MAGPLGRLGPGTGSHVTREPWPRGGARVHGGASMCVLVVQPRAQPTTGHSDRHERMNLQVTPFHSLMPTGAPDVMEQR